MTPQEIIQRVADQSFLLCFGPDELDSKGKVVKKITREMVGLALKDLLDNPPITLYTSTHEI